MATFYGVSYVLKKSKAHQYDYLCRAEFRWLMYAYFYCLKLRFRLTVLEKQQKWRQYFKQDDTPENGSEFKSWDSTSVPQIHFLILMICRCFT